MNAILIAALARARMAAKPVRKSAWSDDHRNPHTYAPHDAITREGARALATEGFLLQLSAWREEKTDGGLLLVADMGLWHASSGLWWPMTPWKEPLKGGENRSEAWHAAQVAARAYAHREVCSLEVLDESRAAGLPLPPKEEAPVDGLSQEDRYAFARAVGAPTEEEERELRKSETEAQLRAASTPQNGTAPHIDPDPTLAPVKRGELIAFDAKTGKAPVLTCPVCKGSSPVSVAVVCQGCRRSVCLPCSTTDDESPEDSTTCTDCNTAEENADCAPPHLPDEACEAARRMLDDGRPRAYVLATAGVEVLGSGPLGLLLKFDGAVFRLDNEQLERWLRGDLTVGIDEDEDQGEEEDGSSLNPSSEPTAPGTSPGAGSLNQGKGAPGTSPGSSGCKTAASESTPPPAAGGVPPPEPPAPSSLPESAGPAASPPEVPAVQSPAEASGGGAHTHPNASCKPECQATQEHDACEVPCAVCGVPVDPLECRFCGRPTCSACWVRRERPHADGQPNGDCRDCSEAKATGHNPPALAPKAQEAAREAADRGLSLNKALEVVGARILGTVGAGQRVMAMGTARWLFSGLPDAWGWLRGMDPSEYESWRASLRPQDEGSLLQPTPALLSAVDVILANGEAARKALGKEWAEFPSHRATKKPAGSCALCPHPISLGQPYHTGRGKKWTGKKSHALCVSRLLEGRDPSVSVQAQLEEDAKRAMASAGGATT